MYNFDNSEIKIVLEKILERKYDEAKKHCYMYIEENEDDTIYVCKYITKLLDGCSARINELANDFAVYDICLVGAELVRLLDTLEYEKNKFYFNVLEDASVFIVTAGKKYYDYPEEREKSKNLSLYKNIYDNGVMLRGLALNLASHFYKNNDYENELKMLGIRVFITDIVMNELTYFVVPSIVDYADCLYRLKEYSQVYDVCKDLYDEFGWIVDEYEIEKKLEISVEDVYVIKALNTALKYISNVSPEKLIDLELNKIKRILSRGNFVIV